MNGHYGVTAFVVSNTLSAMPFLILITFLSGTVCYFMVRLHPGFTHYLFFVVCLYASVTVVESLMMVIASIVPNFLMGIIIGAGIQVLKNFISFPSISPKLQPFPTFLINFLFCFPLDAREYLCLSLDTLDSQTTFQSLSGVTQCLTSVSTFGHYR